MALTLYRVLVVSPDAEVETLLRAGGPGSARAPDELRRARDAAEAAELPTGWTPGAVLLDARAGDGAAACHYDRLRAAVPAAPVVLLVRDDQEAEAVEAVGAGAADYVLESHMRSSVLPRTLAAVARARDREGRVTPPGPPHLDRERLLALAGRVGRIGGWAIDLASDTVYWSDEVCAVHEAPPGTRLRVEEGISYFPPEWRPMIVERMRACAEEGTPYDVELEKLTFRGNRVWVRSIGEAVRDADGKITHIQGAFQDITAQKREQQRAAQALAAAEAHYRRLVENAPYGMYVLDGGGHLLELNPAAERIVGWPAGALLGEHFSAVIDPSELPALSQQLARVMAGEADDVELDTRVLRPSGEQRLVRATVSAVLEDGHVVGLHGIVRDVTDEAERETALRRAERLATVGTLIGGVAHELNNPLHSVRSFAALMLLTHRDDEDRESLEIIRREADRAAKIVADLRELARETHGAGRERSAVDLNDVARHVVKLRRYSLDTGNVEVRLEMGASLPRILADRGDVEQVLLNLVVNAEQAMRDVEGERRLTLRTFRTPRGAGLELSDTGPGIPAHLHERIYDPFFTTKDPGEGTGLGLSLVHGIVTEHGGTIALTTPPGGGASFRVDFPAANVPPAEAAPSEPEREGSAQGGLRVLVVDDEPSIRLVTTRYLQRRGHRVDDAADGAEALALLDSGSYDVIVSDLRMPGVGGEELFRRLRAKGGQAPRMLFVTGDVDGSHSLRDPASAAIPILFKPVQLDELADTVERLARSLPAPFPR